MIKKAVGGLVLALGAIAAQATTVEVILDVVVTGKTDVYLGMGTQDTGFAPTPFSMSFRFDLEHPYQLLTEAMIDPPLALTIMDYASTSSTPSVFSDALLASRPSDPYDREITTQIGYVRTLDTLPANHDEATPTTVFINSTTSLDYMVDGPAPFWYIYERSFVLQEAAAALSVNELSPISSEAFVAVLQSKTGVLLPGAYTERDRLIRYNYPLGTSNVTMETGTTYKGDVVIRSVTTVPEPGTWALMGMGLAVMSWGLGKRRRHNAL